MINFILLIGSLLGLTSVGMGAYVDHVLSHAVDIKTLSMIKTALHYQQLYAVIITAIGLSHRVVHDSLCLRLSAWIFIAGSIIFCFSIYLSALMGMAALLKLTPVGGIFLMTGWVVLACASFNKIFLKSHP